MTTKLAVADPGFPRGGGANSPGGRQHTILPNFPKNCMKLKEFGPPGEGARPKFYYVDPPLASIAHDIYPQSCALQQINLAIKLNGLFNYCSKIKV